MESIGSIVGNTGIPALVYYLGMTIVSIFLGGWALNGKIKTLCKEALSELDKDMKSIETRLQKLETEALRIEVHNKDLLNIFQYLNDLRNDFKDGFKGLNARIDALLLATSKD